MPGKKDQRGFPMQKSTHLADIGAATVAGKSEDQSTPFRFEYIPGDFGGLSRPPRGGGTLRDLSEPKPVASKLQGRSYTHPFEYIPGDFGGLSRPPREGGC